MKNIHCVVGAGYGDEGKGMYVNHLSKCYEHPIVIRANGGAQCGHTVVENGRRYVFSHIGSGSVQGAATFLSKYMVLNPVLFLKEVNERHVDLNPIVFVDSACQVSTPFDMLYNQYIEQKRDNNRHGSVGVGFGATLERVDNGISLTYNDLESYRLKERVNYIRSYWLNKMSPKTLEKTRFLNNIKDYFYDDYFLDRFIIDCKMFLEKTRKYRFEDILHDYDTLIFENGQGLLLDQEYGHFPYVTRSNTGYRNISKLLKRYNQHNENITVYYLTRAYTTRHGAGPLPFEHVVLNGINVVDETNVWNMYQHGLRLAPLNLKEYEDAIRWDSTTHTDNVKIERVVTCVDHVVGPEVVICKDGRLFNLSKKQFIDELYSHFDVVV